MSDGSRNSINEILQVMADQWLHLKTEENNASKARVELEQKILELTAHPVGVEGAKTYEGKTHAVVVTVPVTYKLKPGTELKAQAGVLKGAIEAEPEFSRSAYNKLVKGIQNNTKLTPSKRAEQLKALTAAFEKFVNVKPGKAGVKIIAKETEV